MSSDSTKIHLPVTKDLNGGYKFSNYPYRVQLSGDIRRGGFWLQQYAERLGMENFLTDLFRICEEIEKDNIIRKQNGEYPIGIFNLYIQKPSQNGSSRNP